jgi:hypothetical protein
MDQREAPAIKSRRAVLVAGVGGALATVAHLLGRPDPALAADGDPVLVGGSHTGSTETSISISGDDPAIHGTSEAGIGLRGSGGTGVFGEGTSGGGGQIGVSGRVMGSYGDAMGVYGFTEIGVGVEGQSTTGTGVAGSGGTGVAGLGAIGVAGQGTQIGVRGGGNQVGVQAVGAIGGIALEVKGRASFSLSGVLSVAKGKASATSAGALPLHTGSIVVAVVRTGDADTWVRKVVPTNGKFTVYLNKTVSTPTTVAWIAFG